MARMEDSPVVRKVADEARVRLRAALDALEPTAPQPMTEES
jgi:hypothetical protein